MVNRLALGGAQFGMPYGIANRLGRIGRDDGEAILRRAWAAGIDTVDTAIAYGASEALLGEIGVDRWKVVSKLPLLPEEGCPDIDRWVRESVDASLGRLGISRLYGLLLHHPQQLLGSQGEELYSAISGLKDLGKVVKIGISVYGPEELAAIWPHFRFDLVQAPFNILDRRMANSGWFSRLHEAGTEVQVRSIFLQGLLLMEGRSRPAAFSRWDPLWQSWGDWLRREGISPLRACVAFALAQCGVDRVLVGVDSLAQLEEAIAGAASAAAPPPASLVCDDIDLINPSKWPLH